MAKFYIILALFLVATHVFPVIGTICMIYVIACACIATVRHVRAKRIAHSTSLVITKR